MQSKPDKEGRRVYTTTDGWVIGVRCQKYHSLSHKYSRLPKQGLSCIGCRSMAHDHIARFESLDAAKTAENQFADS